MRHLLHKSQSAVEFLSTYSFMFLIVAGAIALMFLFLGIPQRALPLQCQFYSGFNCLDAVYTNSVLSNTATGSTLFIVATYAQPGAMNISNFSAYLNYGLSTNGFCVPKLALPGQAVYCFANFTTIPKLGDTYTGTFKIVGNFCANGPGNLSNFTCASGNGYTFGGNVRVQSETLQLGLTRFVPIVVTNTGGCSGAIPAHSQILIQFSPLRYITTERPDLGNIRFLDFRGKYVNSWCELNCTSSSPGNALFWLKINTAIPPLQNSIFSMYIFNFSLDYNDAFRFAGEAPQLSTPYGINDNGQNVFNFYDNFIGRTLNLNNWAPNGANYVVNSGFTYKPYAPYDILISVGGAAASPYIIDFMGSPTGSNINGLFFDANSPTANSPANVWQQTGSNTFTFNAYTGGTYQPLCSQQYNTVLLGNKVFTVQENSSVSQFWAASQINYSTPMICKQTPNPLGNIAGFFGPGQLQGGQIESWQWFRARSYTPANCLSIKFG